MDTNTRSIYDLLDEIRPRPAMYLGEFSITRLDMFLNGYESALFDFGIRDFKGWGLPGLNSWVRARLEQKPEQRRWANSILEACKGDESQALTRFYELLDEYRSGQFADIVELWEAKWEAIWEAEEEQEGHDKGA